MSDQEVSQDLAQAVALGVPEMQIKLANCCCHVYWLLQHPDWSEPVTYWIGGTTEGSLGLFDELVTLCLAPADTRYYFYSCEYNGDGNLILDMTLEPDDQLLFEMRFTEHLPEMTGEYLLFMRAQARSWRCGRKDWIAAVSTALNQFFKQAFNFKFYDNQEPQTQVLCALASEYPWRVLPDLAAQPLPNWLFYWLLAATLNPRQHSRRYKESTLSQQVYLSYYWVHSLRTWIERVYHYFPNCQASLDNSAYQDLIAELTPFLDRLYSSWETYYPEGLNDPYEDDAYRIATCQKYIETLWWWAEHTRIEAMAQIPELKQDLKRLCGAEQAGLYQKWRLRWVENELVLAAFEGIGPESWVWECDLEPS